MAMTLKRLRARLAEMLAPITGEDHGRLVGKWLRMRIADLDAADDEHENRFEDVDLE